MKRRRRPRQYQYLDSPMAEGYLSDLTGDLPEGGSSTGRYSDSEQKDRGLRYRGTGFGRTRGTEESSEDQENFRYNPEAIFSRLYEELDRETEEGKILARRDSLNRDSWSDLIDGDIIQITGTISIPEALKAMEASKAMERYLPYLDQISEWAGEDLGIGEKEKALISGLGGMRDVAEAQGSTVIIIALAKSPRYRFVATLKKDYLRIPLEDLEGEGSKVVGTINRKINRGDPPIGLEQLIPGLGAMRTLQGEPPPANRAARRAKDKKEQDENPLSIGFPAATLTPIAIFR